MTWFLRNYDQVLSGLLEHIIISLSSLLIAFVIAFFVGLWAARSESVFKASIAISGFLYTIPTLAFLALLIPVVGLGKTNAIIVMVAFSLLILIRNVAIGIRGAPAEVVDAARGMGMSGTASGSSIRRTACAPVMPIPRAASTTSRSTWRTPT